MRESVTETCLAIHPVQFWSVGISFVDDGLVLKIPAVTSLSNTFAHYRVFSGSDLHYLVMKRTSAKMILPKIGIMNRSSSIHEQIHYGKKRFFS